MPKLPVDYSKTIIYKIVCKDINIKECYVGSTTNLSRRKAQHKSVCNNPNSKKYNIYLYQFIRANGGMKNWNCILVEKCENCKSGDEKLQRERYWLETLQAKLNSCRPIITIDEKKELIKDWRENNKELIKDYMDIYNKKYKEMNRDKLNEKTTCECGSMYTLRNKARHIKSIKHKKHQHAAIIKQ